jgi:hypothetical protein
MVDALAAAELGEDVVLLVVQLRRDDAGDRLADHLLGGIAEQAQRRGVPRGHPTLGRLADDGVVGGRDDRGEPRRMHFIGVPLGDVDEHADRPGQAAGRVAQRRRIGQEIDPRAVRPFRDRLDPAHRASLLEGHGHRALIVR